MDSRGLAARVSDLSSVYRRIVISLMLALTAGSSWWALTALSTDLPVSVWFPGSAAAVTAVLMSRRRRVAVSICVAAVLFLVVLAAGRPLEVSLAYGLAIALEAWVVVRLLTRGKSHPALRNLNQLGWFFVSSALGVMVVVFVAGVGASIASGANPMLLATALFVSHFSAVIVLVPVVLVPVADRLQRPMWEPIVQTVVLVGLSILVFGPATSTPVTFLLLTNLLWAAARFPPIFVTFETLGLALLATVSTSMGVGPFDELPQDDVRSSIFALQLFLLTYASACLFVAAQSFEWRTTASELAERERGANLVAQELRELNDQKDQFIEAVSHELRTPVTSILGFAEDLAASDGHFDTTSNVGRIIYRNAKRLAETIEDVLALSQLSTQSTIRPSMEVDVRKVLEDCVEDATGLVAQSKKVHVRLVAPAQPVTMIGVEQDFARVCANLLSNAIKFSPAGSTVTVTLDDEDADELELLVSDEGPGIPLAEQEAVWDRFYRVQSPRHSAVPGTGLGLPIVRALVQQRMGGSIELHSDGQHGTTMVVRVPRRFVMPEPSAVESRQDDNE